MMIIHIFLQFLKNVLMECKHTILKLVEELFIYLSMHILYVHRKKDTDGIHKAYDQWQKHCDIAT